MKTLQRTALKKLRDALGNIRRALGKRPPIRLLEYDEYWANKRAKGVAELSPFQAERVLHVATYLDQCDEVVDIGAGDGSVLMALRDLRGIQPIAVDISGWSLNTLCSVGLKTIAADISNADDIGKIPECDWVLLLEVIEHIPDPERIIPKLLLKTRKGVIVSFPNTGYLSHRIRLLFGRFPLQWRCHPGEHLRFWTYTDAVWWKDQIPVGNDGDVTTTVDSYEGIPFLNRVRPHLFAEGLIVVFRINQVPHG